jgi:CTP synthase (UTP-ammonia lyase)
VGVESPIVIDVWTVESSRHEELVRVLSEKIRNLLLGWPGFVSAHIYESAGGGTVLCQVQMRTAADRQSLTDAPQFEQAYREVREIATSHRHFYRLVESFRQHAPAGDG